MDGLSQGKQTGLNGPTMVETAKEEGQNRTNGDKKNK